MTAKGEVPTLGEQLDFGFTPGQDGQDRVTILLTAKGNRIVLPNDLVHGLAEAALAGPWPKSDLSE